LDLQPPLKGGSGERLSDEDCAFKNLATRAILVDDTRKAARGA